MEFEEFKLSLRLAREAFRDCRKLLASTPDPVRRSMLRRTFEPRLRSEGRWLRAYSLCRNRVVYNAAYPWILDRADDLCARLETLSEEVRLAVECGIVEPRKPGA